MRARISSVAFLALSLIVTQAGQVSEALLSALSSEEFKQREQAQSELQELALGGGQAILLELLDHSKNSSDPEVRKRCLAVLRAVSDRDYLTEGKGFLGILMDEIRLEIAGEEKPRTCVRVSQIVKDSPAEEFGLQAGDLIIAVDGKTWHEVGDMEKIREVIANTKPLNRITLSLIRGEKAEPVDLDVVLGRRPSANMGVGLANFKAVQSLARERHFEEWLEELEQSEDAE